MKQTTVDKIRIYTSLKMFAISKLIENLSFEKKCCCKNDID